MFGTPSSIVGALMIFLSITMSPEWTINQSISALGGGGFGSVVFESGLLIAGSMAMIFAAGLFEFSEKDFLGMLGSGGVLIYGISVSALGLSLVDLGDFRGSIVYVIFFVVPVSLALMSIHLFKRGLTSYAVIGAIATVISIIPWAGTDDANTLQHLAVGNRLPYVQVRSAFRRRLLESAEQPFAQSLEYRLGICYFKSFFFSLHQRRVQATCITTSGNYLDS